jgi:hypothetical protein
MEKQENKTSKVKESLLNVNTQISLQIKTNKQTYVFFFFLGMDKNGQQSSASQTRGLHTFEITKQTFIGNFSSIIFYIT